MKKVSWWGLIVEPVKLHRQRESSTQTSLRTARPRLRDLAPGTTTIACQPSRTTPRRTRNSDLTAPRAARDLQPATVCVPSSSRWMRLAPRIAVGARPARAVPLPQLINRRCAVLGIIDFDLPFHLGHLGGSLILVDLVRRHPERVGGVGMRGARQAGTG
jgi:hypothetical protein